MVRWMTLAIKSTPLHSAYLFWFYMRNMRTLNKVGARITNKQISLPYKGYNLAFSYETAGQLKELAGLLVEQFVGEQYSWLRVKDQIVLDIGANIGDSAIYFASRGAKHVYAFEPYPSTYDVAKRNVESNRLLRKVTLINKGLGGKHARMTLDYSSEIQSGRAISQSNSGTRVEFITLHDILKKLSIRNAILKIDCEGAEYDIIESTSKKDLECFSQIMIESHYGYDRLVPKLRSAGFKLRLMPERYANNTYASNPDMLVGMLCAWRSVRKSTRGSEMKP